MNVRFSQICHGPSDETLVSGGYDQAVRVWDCRSRSYEPLMTMKPFGDSVTSVVVSRSCVSDNTTQLLLLFPSTPARAHLPQRRMPIKADPMDSVWVAACWADAVPARSCTFRETCLFPISWCAVPDGRAMQAWQKFGILIDVQCTVSPVAIQYKVD